MGVVSRGYTADDLPGLQAALAQWRGQVGLCGYCHVGDLPNRIYEGLRGRRRLTESVRIFSDGPAVSGIAVCGRFGTSFDVFTGPAWRGTEAETAMLTSAYEITRRQMVADGNADGSVVTDVYGCDTVRASLLAGLGFQRYRMWDLVSERRLDGPAPPAVLPDGFTVRPAGADDAHHLARVRNESFDDHWTGEQYLAEVMARPGYQSARELVAVAPDGRFAAFTMTWLDPTNQVGHFEPVGTSRHFRRLGLGRALMLHGLADMRQQGMRVATVQHDATKVAAGELYRGLGFVARYETYGFHRPPCG